LKVLSHRLSNIENSLGKLQVSSVDMAADISHLRRAVNEAQAKSQSIGRQSQLTDLNFPTLAQANVQAQAQAQTQASVQVHTSSQLPELPTRQPAVVVKSQQSSASQSWAGIVASNSNTTVGVGSNVESFPLLSSQVEQRHTDGDVSTEEDGFQIATSRRKRRRQRTVDQDGKPVYCLTDQLTSQPIVNPTVNATRGNRASTYGDGLRQSSTSGVLLDHNTDRGRGKRLLVGKMVASSSGTDSISGAQQIGDRRLIAAVKPAYRKKSVFCIDNVSSTVTVSEMADFITDVIHIDIVSIFAAKSRRRRNDINFSDRQAFRLCVYSSDVEKLLIAEKWPADIVISEWFFKSSVQSKTDAAVSVASAAFGRSDAPVFSSGSSTPPTAPTDRSVAVSSYSSTHYPTSGYPAQGAEEKAADGNLHVDMAVNVTDTSETTILITDSTLTDVVTAAPDGHLSGSNLLNSTMIDNG
jgi:hypothetical protein